METKKRSKTLLIKDFFNLTVNEARTQIMALSELDKLQLASAIARQLGLPQDACDFEFVAY